MLAVRAEGKGSCAARAEKCLEGSVVNVIDGDLAEGWKKARV